MIRTALMVFAILTLVTPPWASASPGEWISLGPTEINGAYGIATGRISDIIADDSGAIIVAGANGGLWRRDPSRGTWQATGDSLSTLAFGAIGHNESIYYAASGEDHNCLDCAGGAGVFKSTDDGRSWTALLGSPVQRTAVLRVSPQDGAIWVGGEKGLFKSTDEGSTWQQVVRADGPFNQPTAIALYPSNSKKLFVGDQSGIYETEDAGMTWRALAISVRSDVTSTNPQLDPDTTFSPSLALARSDPNVMYASFTYNNTNYQFGCLAGLYRSADGGATWQQLKSTPDYFSQTFASGNGVAQPRDVNGWGNVQPGAAYSSGSNSPPNAGADCQGWYDSILAVNPARKKEVYAGGIALIRSEDGGATWSRLGATVLLHPDYHALTFDGLGNAYFGNDGGIFRVDVVSGDVTNLSQGLSITQFYQGASQSADGQYLLAGTQDNGTDRFDTSSTSALSDHQYQWNSMFGGDGGVTAINPNDPSQMYVEYVRGDMQSTSDGGKHWVDIGPPVAQVEWVMPFVVDSTSWNTVYAGGDNVYKTVDGGKTWTAISNWNTNADVSALAISRHGGLILAGMSDGTLAISNDAGNSWALNQRLAQRVTSIALDPTTPTRVYVAMRSDGNPSDGHVFKLSGISSSLAWANISANLPPVNILRMFESRLLAGTDQGVYVLGEDGTWSSFGRGLPRVPVLDIVITKASQLIAITHGRGAWIMSP